MRKVSLTSSPGLLSQCPSSRGQDHFPPQDAPTPAAGPRAFLSPQQRLPQGPAEHAWGLRTFFFFLRENTYGRDSPTALCPGLLPGPVGRPPGGGEGQGNPRNLCSMGTKVVAQMPTDA